MGTRSLEIVYYHGRFYIVYHQFDSYYEGLGAVLVNRIPEDPEEYQKWLASMRAKYAAKEQALEAEVYTIRPADEAKNETEADAKAETKKIQRLRVKAPRYSLYSEYTDAPSTLPRLDMYCAENFYIFNLDTEVLTMNFAVHWRMDRIPRTDSLWLTSLRDSIYMDTHTVDLDVCPESLSGLAGLNVRTKLDSYDKVWRALVASSLWSAYTLHIGRFGRQWYPQDLPFRELAFALVSLAAGRQAAFCAYKNSKSLIKCHPLHCGMWHCSGTHIFNTPGWLEDDLFVGDDERRKTQPPLLYFGSPAHWQDQPAGAAPVETTYWLTDDVIIHLSLVVDGTAFVEAMEWGLAQRRATSPGGDSHCPAVHFYVVVLSLFNVAFAEVSLPAESKPKDDEKEEKMESEGVNEKESTPKQPVSMMYKLSALKEDLCLSTHPRNRPVEGEEEYILPHEYASHDSYRHSLQDLQKELSGIAAMVNFFAAIDSRRAASGGAARTNGRLPAELYAHVLDFVDYATWQNYFLVSPLFRALGLAKYRLDDRYALVGGPGRMRHLLRGEQLMTFELKDLVTDKTETVTRERESQFLTDYDWVPVVGRGLRQVAIPDINLAFESVEAQRQTKERWDAKEKEREAAAAATKSA